MAVDKKVKRFEVLRRWSELAGNAGYPVPGEENLRKIADANGPWPADLDLTVVAPWTDTINWLLDQLRLGVAEPISQLPTELLGPSESNTPAPAAPAEPGTAAAPQPVVAPPDTVKPDEGAAVLIALKTWWTRAIERDAPGITGLKEAHLLQVLRSGRRTAEQIAEVLPASLTAFAPDMAAVLSDRDPAAAGSVGSARAGGHAVPEVAVATPAKPVAEPAVSAPREPAGRTAPAVPSADDFAEFDFSEPTGQPERLRAAVSSKGAISVSWAPTESIAGPQSVLYRVVASDEFPPYAPDKADIVAVTAECKAVDDRPFTAAVRYTQVWSNTGATEADALHAQPRMHAQAAIVSPVQHLDIREDEGRVIGQWVVWPGTARVQVYRIPIERAAQGLGDPRYRILAGEPNLGGFVDTLAERGKRYLYQVFAEASVDGVTMLSSPLAQQVLVSAVLTPVTDLSVTLHDDEQWPQFDLVWSDPPAGRVVIYRTQRGPSAGVGEKPLPEQALAQAALPESDRLSHPISPGADGTSSMRDVPWPREWNRTYFTPVTVLDGVSFVGRTIAKTRTGRATQVRIVERVDKQVLTFAWPPGAASVLVYIGPRGQPAETATTGQAQEISQSQYQRLGGMRFPHPLPHRGCSVHLVPVAFAAGEKVLGTASSVEYHGLLRLNYQLYTKRDEAGAQVSVAVRIVCELDLPSSPPFVLVHNPDRLPLDMQDGEVLETVRMGDPSLSASRQIRPQGLSAGGGDALWEADVQGRGGFLRLFVDLPPERLSTVALLDPALPTLLLGQPL